jgi:hypothetical protein
MKYKFLFASLVLAISFISLTAFSGGGTDTENVSARVQELKNAYLDKADQKCRLEAKKEAQMIWEEENPSNTTSTEE